MRALPAKTGKNKKIKKLLPLFSIPAIFFADRASKMAIIRFYSEGQGIEVLPGIFHVTRVNNTGAAFGLLKDNAMALAGISFICVIFLCVAIIRDLLLIRNREDKSPVFLGNLKIYSLSFLAAGAAGNFYDRVRYGYVVDFLDFRVWPVFNIADTFICTGIFLMMVGIFQKKSKAV